MNLFYSLIQKLRIRALASKCYLDESKADAHERSNRLIDNTLMSLKQIMIIYFLLYGIFDAENTVSSLLLA